MRWLSFCASFSREDNNLLNPIIIKNNNSNDYCFEIKDKTKMNNNMNTAIIILKFIQIFNCHLICVQNINKSFK